MKLPLSAVRIPPHCGGGGVVVGGGVVGGGGVVVGGGGVVGSCVVGCVVGGCVVGGGVETASQDLSSEPRVKPVLQLHVNDPSVLVQVWSQPPFPEEHSLISANQNETLA